MLTRQRPGLDGYLFFAEQLALSAMDRIGTGRPPDEEITTKSGPADYVTVTDRAVEHLVRESIHQRFPDHAVVGEELGVMGDGDAEFVWYLDPVDGTTNFVHGLPWSSFSLALRDPTGGAVGVVADPSRREVFGAARGRGARLNGHPIRCRDDRALAGAVVLTEWASHRAWAGMEHMLHELSASQCTTRIMGSSALSVASVGAGRAVAAVLGGYHTWDALAAVIVAREAGAFILGRDGLEHDLPPGEGPRSGLLAVAPGVASQLHRLWVGARD